MLDVVHEFDLVKNTNPKSKKFGQFAIAYGDSYSSTYFHYFDGTSIYTNIKSFDLVKRFNIGDEFLDGTIDYKSGWGRLKIDRDGDVYLPSRTAIMEEMRKYVVRVAKVV